MNRNRFSTHPLPLTMLAAGIVLTSGSVLAEDNAQITVAAARPTVSTTHTRTGISTEVMSITHKVSYADLNLATYSGAVALEKRVNETAKAICARLDTLYPQAKSENPTCVKDAIDTAMVQAHAAISAAEKLPPKS